MMRVLVADDDAELRRLLIAAGAEEGWEMHGVADGVAAWQAIRRDGPWDMLLLDLDMPRMDGVDVLERIRLDPATSGLPVVAVAEGVDPSVRALLHRHRVLAVLEKPFASAEAREAILCAASRRPAAEPSR